MRRFGRFDSLALVAVAVTVVGLGCKGPEVTHPWLGTTRYLACNLHYEKPEITDINHQVGAPVRFGTPVQILKMWANAIQFQPEGHPILTLSYKYGDKYVPFETYIDRMFVDSDPRKKLRKVAPRRLKAMEEGTVEVGMTKDQVLMTLGYPPAHKTPSLEIPTWTYWGSRGTSFVVYFDKGVVSRIQPQ